MKTIYTYLKNEVFHPTAFSLFFHPFYFARKGLFENINLLSKHIKGRVLDVGCGSKPYKHLFANIKEYIGMDIRLPGYSHTDQSIDVFYDGKRFPFRQGSFDAVVTFEVLEHVFNPDEFLQEINRVLKKGGHLLVTVPFVWDEHEQPYDYARYTSFGLKSLLEKHHFEIITQKKSMNDMRVIFQLFNGYMYKKISKYKFYKYRYLSLLSNLIFMAPANIIGSILAKITPKNNDLYLDNVTLARKTKNA